MDYLADSNRVILSVDFVFWIAFITMICIGLIAYLVLRHLRHLSSRLDSLIKIINENVLLTESDNDHRLVFVSELLETDGFNQVSNLIGKAGSTFAASEEQRVAFDKIADEVARTNQPWSGDIRLVKQDGEIFYAHLHYTPRFEGHRRVGFVSVMTDITDRKKLEAMNKRDGLTGAYNRFHADAVLAQECYRAQRYQIPVSLIFIDIDHFKSINDEFGHLKGDETLIAMARVVSENLREADMLARWGGEEFVVLLPSTRLEEAVQVAEKLRLALIAGTTPVPLTASFGVACHSGEDVSPQDLIDQADKALYKAKNAGRNRVEKAIV